jgi:hypothetical protein
MRFIKAFVIPMVILLVMLSFLPGLSQAQGKRVLVSGVIDQLGTMKGSNYISINEKRIVLTRNTTVVDQSGKPLAFRDLKPRLKAKVELIPKPDGSVERRVTVNR